MYEIEKNRKDFTILLVLSILTGFWGVDRFYLDKIGTGILKLITFGGLGIWWFVDIIIIASGNAKDKHGNPVKR